MRIRTALGCEPSDDFDAVIAKAGDLRRKADATAAGYVSDANDLQRARDRLNDALARIRRFRLALGIGEGQDEIEAIRELARGREELLDRLRNLREAIGADKLEHAAEDTPREEAMHARCVCEDRDLYKAGMDALIDALGVGHEVAVPYAKAATELVDNILAPDSTGVSPMWFRGQIVGRLREMRGTK